MEEKEEKTGKLEVIDEKRDGGNETEGKKRKMGRD